MRNFITNAVALAYVGFVVYIVTDPWHDEIGEVITDTKTDVVNTWSSGMFYIQAKVDLFLIT